MKCFQNFTVIHHRCPMVTTCQTGHNDHVLEMKQSTLQQNFCALRFCNECTSCCRSFISNHNIRRQVLSRFVYVLTVKEMPYAHCFITFVLYSMSTRPQVCPVVWAFRSSAPPPLPVHDGSLPTNVIENTPEKSMLLLNKVSSSHNVRSAVHIHVKQWLNIFREQQ